MRPLAKIYEDGTVEWFDVGIAEKNEQAGKARWPIEARASGLPTVTTYEMPIIDMILMRNDKYIVWEDGSASTLYDMEFESSPSFQNFILERRNN